MRERKQGRCVDGGTASVTLNGSTYRVRDVKFHMETSESPWFRIDGEPLEQADAECLPGSTAALSLYGDLPSSVSKPLDLIGKRLAHRIHRRAVRLANFCFSRMGAACAGAEEAWITIESDQRHAGGSFTMSGTFKIYDENAKGPVVLPPQGDGGGLVTEST
jgi:hypothetical protein